MLETLKDFLAFNLELYDKVTLVYTLSQCISKHLQIYQYLLLYMRPNQTPIGFLRQRIF